MTQQTNQTQQRENIINKAKLCFDLPGKLFRLPEHEVQKISELIDQRVKLYGSLYFATVNSRSGQTANQVKAKLKGNADSLRIEIETPPAQAVEAEQIDDFQL